MKTWLLPLALLLLALLAVIWFLVNFERGSVTERRPPNAEAQRNALLAAQRVLQELQLPVRRLDVLQLPTPLSVRATLILPAPRGALSPALLAELENFVQEGGHLLVESESLPLRDPLLEAFGVTRTAFEPGERGSAWGRNSWNWREPTRSGSLDDAHQVSFDPDAPPLALDMRAPHWLTAEAEPRWSHGTGKTALLQLEWGAGRVTAVNSLTPFHNWEIGRYDHAEVLHWLLRDAGADEVVFAQPWQGGLLSWLGQHHWRLLLAAALLLVLLLWAVLPRFGPLQPDPELARRRLLEHLTASGRLLWSRRARDTLARAAVQGALRRLRAEYPHAGSLHGENLARFLMRRCTLDAQQAALLVTPAVPTQPLPFLALVRACRRVHLALAQGTRQTPTDPLYEP